MPLLSIKQGRRGCCVYLWPRGWAGEEKSKKKSLIKEIEEEEIVCRLTLQLAINMPGPNLKPFAILQEMPLSLYLSLHLYVCSIFGLCYCMSHSFSSVRRPQRESLTRLRCLLQNNVISTIPRS
jgi:hypothetical protein